MKKIMGENHKVNLVTIFLDNKGAALVRPKQLDSKRFQKVAKEFKKKIYGIFYWLTDWLTD